MNTQEIKEFMEAVRRRDREIRNRIIIDRRNRRLQAPSPSGEGQGEANRRTKVWR